MHSSSCSSRPLSLHPDWLINTLMTKHADWMDDTAMISPRRDCDIFPLIHVSLYTTLPNNRAFVSCACYRLISRFYPCNPLIIPIPWTSSPIIISARPGRQTRPAQISLIMQRPNPRGRAIRLRIRDVKYSHHFGINVFYRRQRMT